MEINTQQKGILDTEHFRPPVVFYYYLKQQNIFAISVKTKIDIVDRKQLSNI